MEEKLVFLYAMHRYDLIFYARLVEELNRSYESFDFRLIITPNVYSIPYAKKFIHDVFPNFIEVPILDRNTCGFVRKTISVVRLSAWIRSKLGRESTLIICDKSQVLSRCFLKNAQSSVLIQQIEVIDDSYRFDYLRTIRDALLCIFFRSYFALWYTNKLSGGTIRAVKLLSKPINTAIVFHSHHKTSPTSFRLTPIGNLMSSKKIVIFGSRYLTWPFFVQDKGSQSIERLSSIYKFIHSHFPLHEIVYLPHPLEIGVEFCFINHIFGGRLKKGETYFSSEHYLYQNRDISHTFSIGSTSSFSAFNMGYSAKVFYKMLNFPKDVETAFDQIFSGLPRTFFSFDRDELLNPCSRNYTSTDDNDLDAFVNAFLLTSELNLADKEDKNG